MTFLTDESGTETSRPREGIEITTGSGLIPVVYRIATGTRDIVINGQTFHASAAGRSEVKIAAAANQTDLEIQMPLAHPVPQRYMQGGVPPRTISVIVWRKQLTSGEAECIWRGHVTSMAIATDNVAKLLVPARLSRLLRRQLPTITVGRLCPHILYDKNCRVVKYISTAATITYANGRTVRFIGPHPSGYATFGELRHVASGESATIMDSVTTGGTVELTVQLPIGGMQVGDAIEVFVGCDHSIATCRDKFSNVPNYGGFPYLPDFNHFGFTGAGSGFNA